MRYDPDEDSIFEPIRDTTRGKGSAAATNKGIMKRRLKFARVKHKKHGKKAI